MDKMEVKDIIKYKRLQLGLTYEELGKLCEADKTTVRKWELGLIENMRRDKMVLLSKALDISPLVLLGIEECSLSDLNTPSEKKEINVYENLSATGLGKVITKINNPYSGNHQDYFALTYRMKGKNLDELPVYVIFKKQPNYEFGKVVAYCRNQNEFAIIKKYEPTDTGTVLGQFIGFISPQMDV